MHSWSSTFISDFPLSDKKYSTFGGIREYSLRIIKSSFSNSFKLLLKVVSVIFPKYLFISIKNDHFVLTAY